MIRMSYPKTLYKNGVPRSASSEREEKQFRLEGYAPIYHHQPLPCFVYRGTEKLKVNTEAEKAAAVAQGFSGTPPPNASIELAPAAKVESENIAAHIDYRRMLAEANAREDAALAKLALAMEVNKSLGAQLDQLRSEAEQNADLVAQLNQELAEATAPKGRK